MKGRGRSDCLSGVGGSVWLREVGKKLLVEGEREIEVWLEERRFFVEGE